MTDAEFFQAVEKTWQAYEALGIPPDGLARVKRHLRRVVVEECQAHIRAMVPDARERSVMVVGLLQWLADDLEKIKQKEG